MDFSKSKTFLTFTLCFLLAIFVGCEKKQSHQGFKKLMGEDTNLWRFIVSDEDNNNLQLFTTIYQQVNQTPNICQLNIPKQLHYIWLGPKEFPKESIENVISWMNKHPDWTVTFWTDRRRRAPHPNMKIVYFKDYPFDKLRHYYEKSNNYGEKSDLLRYEILEEHGGVYVDHDVVCYKNFDDIMNRYDFFCGLEPPHTPLVKSSITVCNNVIGSIKKHPTIQKCIDNILNRWDKVEQAFPENDEESTLLRIAHRTFGAFDDAVKEKITTSSYRDIVFPAAYFNQIGKNPGIYAHHFYTGTWYKNEDPFEMLVRRQLIKMNKKNNKLLLLAGITAGLNIVFMMIMSIIFFRVRKKSP